MTFFFDAIQCTNGHVVCSTCCSKLKNKCAMCQVPIGSMRCIAIERFLQGFEISCKNEKRGCTKKLRYSEKRKHDKECIYG